jgi:HlyD family secretion protein
MLREVRGLGTLVVEEFIWIPANFESRVEKMNFLPGAKVHPNDVLMVLSNPQMELDMADLEWQIKQAEANYDNLQVQLQTAQLAQQAVTEQVQSDMEQAGLQADRDRALNKLDLKADLDAKLSEAKWNELKGRLTLSKKQLEISNAAIKAQLDAQKILIEKTKAAYGLKKQQVEQLIIRAGVDGVVTVLGTPQTPLEVGMRVAPGAILAKIAQPNKLKATLKIPETQVKDVALGQVASVDTRNGIIPGHVTRIDPASVNGTVDVDVKLEGEAPGMRPDLSVDGTITIERLADVVFVGRPVIGQPGAKITLFKLDPDSKEAQRIPVSLGRSSVNTIEVVDGLKVGDQVILSDMSAQDAFNRIRLN